MSANVSTSTVGVNAAFLQEVKEDNVMLHDLLGAASKVLDPAVSTPIQTRSMADLFGKLRDQLAIHFALEEGLGYLEDVIVQTPRLCEVAFQLRAEHETLYVTISELADDAERLLMGGGPIAKPMLLKRFRRFCHQLKEHERREDDLIIESLYDELGVCD